MRRLLRSVPAAHLFALAFCAYAATGVAAIALLMPPFQAADERAHDERADQVSRGGLLAIRLGDGWSGGLIDGGIAGAAEPLEPLKFHPERKVTRAMIERSGRVSWRPPADARFPNTAAYPPLFYAPAAVGIVAGRSAGWPVRRTLTASRLLTGAASTAVATLAIALADGLAPLLFTLLCLPMSLALFAAVSPDGPTIATAALAAALLARAGSSRPGEGSGRWVPAASLCLCLVAVARPAYLPLCLAPLLLPGGRWRRASGSAAAVAGVLAWVLLAGRVALSRPSAEQVSLQVHAIMAHPGILGVAAANVARAQWAQGLPYAQQFVGVLGWLDTPLPRAYDALTGVVLAGAALASLPSGRAPLGGGRRALLAFLLGASGLAVFVAEYLSWSPVGGTLVEGVQGRYFLPLAPFAVLLLPGSRHLARCRASLACMAPLLLYPALSLALTVRAIAFRYYL